MAIKWKMIVFVETLYTILRWNESREADRALDLDLGMGVCKKIVGTIPPPCKGKRTRIILLPLAGGC
jgi:hypothetical protein